MHLPVSVGFVWGVSVGTSVPLLSFDLQLRVLSSHQLPAVQSASTLQPAAGRQVRSALHAPERHTTAALASLHGPAPLSWPQRLSAASHTWLWQTRAAAGPVQLPSRVGVVCGASVGNAVLLAKVGVQACSVSLHQLPLVQSASTLQPVVGLHSKFVLHEPERHTVPALAVVHGP